MSDVGSATAPLATFADLDGDLWGVVVGGDRPQAAVGRLSGADVALQAADLDTSEDDVWTLLGGGCDLRLERAEATTLSDADSGLDPCRVTGSVEFDGRRREFDVGGVRGRALSVAGSDSLRLFAAWFPAGHEIAMVSTRPHGAKGNDRDSVRVVARGEEHRLVIDPRLSTTYDAAGNPRRVGLELWLGDDPDGDLWPRRVAGSSTGSTVVAAGFSAYALQCVSRGEPGAGVYLLLRP